jgi:hypothetical protein
VNTYLDGKVLTVFQVDTLWQGYDEDGRDQFRLDTNDLPFLYYTTMHE